MTQETPEYDEEYDKKIKKHYHERLENRKSYGFEPSAAEAIYIRKMIMECFDESDELIEIEKKTQKESMDILIIYPETLGRFFRNYYGINLFEYTRYTKLEDHG